MSEITNLLKALEALNPENLQTIDAALDSIAKKFERMGATAPDELKTEMLDLQNQKLEFQLTALERSQELYKAQAVSMRQQIDLMKAGEKYTQAEIEAQEEKLQAIEEIATANGKQIEDSKQILELKLGINEASQETLEANKQIGEKVTNWLGGLTGIDDSWKGTLVGGLVDAASRSDDLVGALGQVKKQLDKQFDAANMLGSTYMKLSQMMAGLILLTLDFALAQDNMVASVRQAAVGSREFDNAVVDAHLNVRTLGVSTEEMGAAFASLHSNMAEFTNLTQKGQVELLEFTALMGEMGVSTDVTAGNFQVLTKSLGMTVEQATTATRQMAGTAQAIGMPIEEMMKGFQQSAPILAKYGQDAPAVFAKVAAASKATGVSIQGLLNITEQFDTFEGAAEAAGKLNALLGGSVNALELLNATEEDRIGILIRSFEASGKNWKAMSRFERQAIANAAGITDMAEANAVFGQSSAAYEEMLAKTEATAMSQEQLEAATRAQMSVQDKLNTLMQAFAVSMRPVMEGLGRFLDFVLMLRKEMDTGFNVAMGTLLVIMAGMAVVVGTLIGLFVVYKMVVAAAQAVTFFSTLMNTGLAGALAAVGAAGPAAAAGIQPVAPALAQVGAAAQSGLGLFQLLALAVAAIGVAVAAMAIAFIGLIFLIPVLVEHLEGLVKLTSALPGMLLNMSVALIIAGVGLSIFVTMMATLASLLLPAIPAIMALSYALGLLGVGVLALSIGLKTFTGVVGELPKTVDILWSLIPSLFGLLIVGAYLAPAMFLLGYALLPLGMGLLSLGIGLNLIKKNIKTLGRFVAALNELALSIAGLLVIGMYLAPYFAIVGLALLPMGIALAALGIGLLAMGVGLKKIRREAKSLGDLAVGLSVLAVSLGLVGAIVGGGVFIIGAAFIVLGLGLMAMAAGVKSLGKAMKNLTNDGVVSLGLMLAALAAGLTLLGNPLAFAGARTLTVLGSAGFPDLVESATKLTPANVKAVGEVVKAAEKYTIVQSKMKDTGDDSFIELLNELKGLLKGGGKKSGNSGKQTIVLKIGERAFARAVVDALEEHNGLEIG